MKTKKILGGKPKKGVEVFETSTPPLKTVFDEVKEDFSKETTVIEPKKPTTVPLPEELRIVIERVNASSTRLAKLDDEVRRFNPKMLMELKPSTLKHWRIVVREAYHNTLLMRQVSQKHGVNLGILTMSPLAKALEKQNISKLKEAV